jgi:GTP pyrophosphokinase
MPIMIKHKNTFYFNQDGTIDPEAWLNHIMTQRPEGCSQLIRHAVILSQLEGKANPSSLGMSYLQQSLTMADLLLDLMLDEETLAAALVYSSVRETKLDVNIVQEQLGVNVAKLLRGSLRMENISGLRELTSWKQNQIENFRKMVLAMADDMRVVLIKLAERVVLMRTSKHLSSYPPITRQYAQETLVIYAPLANRLGVNDLRFELEDLALERLAPQVHKRISQLLKESPSEREAYLQELETAVDIALSQSGIQNFNLSTRAKNFYGIYRKMRQKKLPFHKIYDTNALRITVNTIEECYQTLRIIQNLWPSFPEKLDDYIVNPKANGYRSLHVVIYSENHKTVEIQIRTYEMHQESEHGIAAHWQYKEGASQKQNYHAKIAWLRQVLAWQKELVKSGSHLMPGLTTILDDRVYILTAENEILDLPKGATALDCAYQIHSDVGHHCLGAKINGIMAPLTYTLNTGDQIEILTDKNPTLKWHWLNPSLGYLQTAKAKAKVLHWFRQKKQQQHIVAGQLLLEKECQRLAIRTVDKDKLAKDLHFKSYKAFLAALGSGELRTVQLLPILYRHNQLLTTLPPKDLAKKQKEKTVMQPIQVMAGETVYTVTQLARCCTPVFGDKILGLVNLQRGFILHRVDCINIKRLSEQAQSRIRKVEWPPLSASVYPASILMKTNPPTEIVTDIILCLKQENIRLINLSVNNDVSQQSTHLNVTVEVQNSAVLKQLLEHLSHITGVISVKRI